MTNSPASASSTGPLVPDPFTLLHPGVQRWIWDHEWRSLRPTQLLAVAPILAADRDVLISASTASGKTEAAWLPILSRLAFDAEQSGHPPGFEAIYISPLKALINDQAGRLTELAGYVDLPVTRRHGDVTGAERDRTTKTPAGLLLITPESLEALFVTRGHEIPRMFGSVRYVVIDELHSFMGGERGVQVQSLLHRLENATGRQPVRIGLSATISDLDTAADFLRPGGGRQVAILTGEGEAQAEIRIQVRGYLDANPNGTGGTLEGTEEMLPARETSLDHPESSLVGLREPASDLAITAHLYQTLRGNDNLVFGNAKAVVEKFSDRLRRRSEHERVPNEFFAHHGNLARELREEVEERLRNPELPTTAVCTSTLELGIDIGAVDAIAQLRAPYSVSALRQRLGRSGRRGNPAVLRVYVPEVDIDSQSSIGARLRVDTVQTISVIELLIEKWYEPPGTRGLHL